MGLYKKIYNKIKKSHKNTIVGTISGACGMFVISLISVLLGDFKAWVILVVFFTSICFILSKLEITDIIFDWWCKDVPKFVHYGIITGTVISSKPLIAKIYGKN